MDDTEDEAKRLYKKYITAWNAQAFAEIADCYAEPSVFVLPHQTVVLKDRAETVALMRQLFTDLNAAGFSHSEIGGVSAAACAEGTVILDARDVRRMHEDGSILETIDAHYVIKLDGGQWRIAVTVVCDPGWQSGASG